MTLPDITDFPELAPELYFRLEFRNTDTVSLVWRYDLEVVTAGGRRLIAREELVPEPDLPAAAARLAKEAYLVSAEDRAKAAVKKLNKSLKERAE